MFKKILIAIAAKSPVVSQRPPVAWASKQSLFTQMPMHKPRMYALAMKPHTLAPPTLKTVTCNGNVSWLQPSRRVHKPFIPGTVFLSENAAFAKACEAVGVAFIGPSPTAIEAMGLKAQSKRLMAAAGVPLVPGYHGDNQAPDYLKSQADGIGYPVLVKASAGGGGKGMRIVSSSDAFLDALQACKREALNSFANDDVLIEKYVQRPRHIEIQVFGTPKAIWCICLSGTARFNGATKKYSKNHRPRFDL